MSTELNLDAIKQRAGAATKGPLYSEANEHNDAFDLCDQPDSSETRVYLECDPTDTAFITAAYTDIPALIAEVERLRGAHKKFASELDFLEPETGRYPELDEMLDPIADAFSAENDHFECARVCEACGEVLASVPCEECHGSGCGPGTALGAYEECSECAGAGKTHPSCTGASYAGLTEEVERLRGIVERVRESIHAVRHALHLTGDLYPREVLHHITTAMETE